MNSMISLLLPERTVWLIFNEKLLEQTLRWVREETYHSIRPACSKFTTIMMRLNEEVISNRSSLFIY